MDRNRTDIFRFGEITTPYQDCINLLVKVECINDIVSYNSTLAIGEKYQDWILKHKELILDLVDMLNDDIARMERKR